MRLSWQPALTLALHHAAARPAPLKLVPCPQTARAMQALGLRADPSAPPGTLALFARADAPPPPPPATASQAAGHMPLLQAPADLVLTFRIEAATPGLVALTDLPEPPLVRCFSNLASGPPGGGGAGGPLGLAPPAGEGVAPHGPVLDLSMPAAKAEASLTRVASGAVVRSFSLAQGRIGASLAALPEGRYALAVPGRPTLGFYLLPGAAPAPFGAVEIVLRSARLPAAQRLIGAGGLQPQSYALTLPARPCLLRYTVLGLTPASEARIEAVGGAASFAPMVAASFGGRTGLTTTSTRPVPLLADGPACTLHYRADGTGHSLPLPTPASGRIGPEPGSPGGAWVSAAYVYL